jgi:hypothetical protein
MSDYLDNERAARAKHAEVLIAQRLNMLSQIAQDLRTKATGDKGTFAHIGSMEGIASDLLDITNRFPGVAYEVMPESVCLPEMDPLEILDEVSKHA